MMNGGCGVVRTRKRLLTVLTYAFARIGQLTVRGNTGRLSAFHRQAGLNPASRLKNEGDKMETYAIEKCIELAKMSPHDEIRNHVVPTAQGQLSALKELLGYVQRRTEDRSLHYDMRHLILEGRIARLKREMTQIIEELENLYQDESLANDKKELIENGTHKA